MRVLLIEDDDLVGEAIQVGMQLQDMDVVWVRDGEQGTEALKQPDYEVVVLDLALPKRGGLDLLRQFRASGRRTPVLILTAADAVEDRITGLDAGADDYLAKPFDLNELGARLRALHRRATGLAAHTMIAEDISFDAARLEVRVNGTPLPLAPREAKLLQLLLEQHGRVVSVERIQDRLYGWNESVESNAVAVHVHNLRRKLGRDVIETVRGAGYRIAQKSH